MGPTEPTASSARPHHSRHERTATPVYRSPVDATKLLDDLCVKLGYCLPPEDQQRIINDPPTSVDSFTDAVVSAEGFDPLLMTTEQRQQVRRVVAAAFGEPVRPTGRTWRSR